MRLGERLTIDAVEGVGFYDFFGAVGEVLSRCFVAGEGGEWLTTFSAATEREECFDTRVLFFDRVKVV